MLDKTKRNSGLLLHISSLPGTEAIGTLGDEAFEFIDLLHEANQSIWQILPLGHTGFANSPYASFSAFAGNPFLINLEKLGYNIKKLNIKSNAESVDYEYVKSYKKDALKEIAESFIDRTLPQEFRIFEKENEFWIHDYALFISLKQYYGCKSFSEFDRDIILRKPQTITEVEKKFEKEILVNKVIQYFFYSQWFELKKYANSKSIEIFGDIPLYVAEDSADLWSRKENFYVDKNLKPLEVAGVPPDYFSEIGQLWGNPVYNWEYLEKTDFEWWVKRMEHNLRLFDILRIDHFRGLLQFWAVDYGKENAVKGEWRDVPSEKFLDKIYSILPDAKLVAEDLGVITDDVTKLRKKYKMPGMKVLQFAFDSDCNNVFLPHNFSYNYFAYTGTHDNDTTLGWFEKIDDEKIEFINNYFVIDKKNIPQSFVKLLWSTVAKTAIAPVQDILNLSSEARINIPGTNVNNWTWRMKNNSFSAKVVNFLKEITELYGRTND